VRVDGRGMKEENQLDARHSLSVAHALISLAACNLLVLIGQLVRLRPSSQVICGCVYDW